MSFKKLLVLLGLAFLLMATAKVVLAEETATVLAEPKAITSDQSDSLVGESDLQWVWGEIINLDNLTRVVTLKYLDYETDQEKELILMIDEKTNFENIKDFNELQLSDTLSVDYLAGADNKNIARNINLEKPDNSVVVLPEATAVGPVQPIAQPEIPLDSPSLTTENSSSMVSPVPAAIEGASVVQD